MNAKIQFCPECGTQLPGNAEFCVECGTRLDSGDQPESKEPVPDKESAAPVPAKEIAAKAARQDLSTVTPPVLLDPPPYNGSSTTLFIPTTEKPGWGCLFVSVFLLLAIAVNSSSANFDKRVAIFFAIIAVAGIIRWASSFFSRHGIEIDKAKQEIRFVGSSTQQAYPLSDFPNLSIEYWKGVLSGDSEDTEHQVALVRLFGDRREILAAGTREIHPWLQKLDDEGREAAKKAAYRIAGFLQRPVIDRTRDWPAPALCQNMPRQPFPDPAKLSNIFRDCCSWSDGQLSRKDATGQELMKISGNNIRLARCSLFRDGQSAKASSEAGEITRENLTEIFVATSSVFSPISLILRSEKREFAVSGFWTEEDALWLRSAVISMLCQ